MTVKTFLYQKNKTGQEYQNHKIDAIFISFNFVSKQVKIEQVGKFAKGLTVYDEGLGQLQNPTFALGTVSIKL